jgi:hypothetical protein
LTAAVCPHSMPLKRAGAVSARGGCSCALWNRLLGGQRLSLADYVAVTETHERGAGRRKASESPNVGYAPKSRVNDREAEAVVDCIRSLWAASRSTPTLGVVTFNEPQQQRILDLLDERPGRTPPSLRGTPRNSPGRTRDRTSGFSSRILKPFRATNGT